MADQAKDKEAAARADLKKQAEVRTAAAKSAPEAGKPTPTQEENDLAKMGVYIPEKEPDGSPEQPQGATDKQVEGSKPGGYTTRQASPSKPAA